MEAHDEKALALRQRHAFHRHPESVRDPLFRSHLPFFDARDVVQVRYELLRRVQQEGQSVPRVTILFGFSRSAFYALCARWEQAGFIGLLPAPPGPQSGSKLTEEVLAVLREQIPPASAADLAQVLQKRWGLQVHPRSIERALARQRGKRGRP
jgi:transposase